jgi:hypothetical protein
LASADTGTEQEFYWLSYPPLRYEVQHHHSRSVPFTYVIFRVWHIQVAERVHARCGAGDRGADQEDALQRNL